MELDKHPKKLLKDILCGRSRKPIKKGVNRSSKRSCKETTQIKINESIKPVEEDPVMDHKTTKQVKTERSRSRSKTRELESLEERIGVDLYEVDRIIDERIVDRKKEYFVTWVGYGEEDWSWEPYESLRTFAQIAIRDWHKRKKEETRPWNREERMEAERQRRRDLVAKTAQEDQQDGQESSEDGKKTLSERGVEASQLTRSSLTLKSTLKKGQDRESSKLDDLLTPGRPGPSRAQSLLSTPLKDFSSTKKNLDSRNSSTRRVKTPHGSPKKPIVHETIHHAINDNYWSTSSQGQTRNSNNSLNSAGTTISTIHDQCMQNLESKDNNRDDLARPTIDVDEPYETTKAHSRLALEAKEELGMLGECYRPRRSASGDRIPAEKVPTDQPSMNKRSSRNSSTMFIPVRSSLTPSTSKYDNKEPVAPTKNATPAKSALPNEILSITEPPSTSQASIPTLTTALKSKDELPEQENEVSTSGILDDGAATLVKSAKKRKKRRTSLIPRDLRQSYLYGRDSKPTNRDVPEESTRMFYEFKEDPNLMAAFDEPDEYDPENMDIDREFLANMNEPKAEAHQHICEFCTFSAEDLEVLKRHQAIQHFRHIIYKCPICDAEYNYKKNFYEHMASHFEDFVYKCQLCDHQSDKIHEYLSHRITHTNEKIYKCNTADCLFTSILKSSLVIHRLVHTRERPFSCNECHRKFGIKSNLEAHKTWHEQQKNRTLRSTHLRCRKCNIDFTLFKNLIQHYEDKHPGETIPEEYQYYRCSTCQEPFRTIRERRFHEVDHINGKLKYCRECNFLTRNVNAFNRHREEHICVETCEGCAHLDSDPVPERLKFHKENCSMLQNMRQAAQPIDIHPNIPEAHLNFESENGPVEPISSSKTATTPSVEIPTNLLESENAPPMPSSPGPSSTTNKKPSSDSTAPEQPANLRFKCQNCSFSTDIRVSYDQHKKKKRCISSSGASTSQRLIKNSTPVTVVTMSQAAEVNATNEQLDSILQAVLYEKKAQRNASKNEREGMKVSEGPKKILVVENPSEEAPEKAGPTQEALQPVAEDGMDVVEKIPSDSESIQEFESLVVAMPTEGPRLSPMPVLEPEIPSMLTNLVSDAADAALSSCEIPTSEILPQDPTPNEPTTIPETQTQPEHSRSRSSSVSQSQSRSASRLSSRPESRPASRTASTSSSTSRKRKQTFVVGQLEPSIEFEERPILRVKNIVVRPTNQTTSRPGSRTPSAASGTNFQPSSTGIGRTAGTTSVPMITDPGIVALREIELNGPRAKSPRCDVSMRLPSFVVQSQTPSVNPHAKWSHIRTRQLNQASLSLNSTINCSPAPEQSQASAQTMILQHGQAALQMPSTQASRSSTPCSCEVCQKTHPCRCFPCMNKGVVQGPCRTYKCVQQIGIIAFMAQFQGASTPQGTKAPRPQVAPTIVIHSWRTQPIGVRIPQSGQVLGQAPLAQSVFLNRTTTPIMSVQQRPLSQPAASRPQPGTMRTTPMAPSCVTFSTPQRVVSDIQGPSGNSRTPNVTASPAPASFPSFPGPSASPLKRVFGLPLRQRCGRCQGCLNPNSCGQCPGCLHIGCLHRICLTTLELDLSEVATRINKNVGCNNCLTCRSNGCQICFVCLDKRYFKNAYLSGAMCMNRVCQIVNNASSSMSNTTPAFGQGSMAAGSSNAGLLSGLTQSLAQTSSTPMVYARGAYGPGPSTSAAMTATPTYLMPAKTISIPANQMGQPQVGPQQNAILLVSASGLSNFVNNFPWSDSNVGPHLNPAMNPPSNFGIPAQTPTSSTIGQPVVSITPNHASLPVAPMVINSTSIAPASMTPTPNASASTPANGPSPDPCLDQPKLSPPFVQGPEFDQPSSSRDQNRTETTSTPQTTAEATRRTRSNQNPISGTYPIIVKEEPQDSLIDVLKREYTHVCQVNETLPLWIPPNNETVLTLKRHFFNIVEPCTCAGVYTHKWLCHRKPRCRCTVLVNEDVERLMDSSVANIEFKETTDHNHHADATVVFENVSAYLAYRHALKNPNLTALEIREAILGIATNTPDAYIPPVDAIQQEIDELRTIGRTYFEEVDARNHRFFKNLI